ncbi:MAG: phosphoribosylamine--glycine ligase [Chlamydiales bacterium]
MMIKYLFSCLAYFSIMQATTYQQAGVDVEKGQQFVEVIKPIVSKTMRSGAHVELGGFGGLFDLKKISYKDPLLVSTTDGVGTKLKVALAANRYDTIGIDLVAMCVNDLLAQGAEPLFFLDYYATGNLDLERGKQLIASMVEGCIKSNCALIGGETAEMAGMYEGEEFDMAGFAVGIVEREQALPKKDEIQLDDIVIGLSSTGLHANGFSLVRKVIADNHIDINSPAPFFTTHPTLAAALLEPTQIYVDAVLPLCQANKIKAISHITGGGLLENIPRVLPDHLKVILDMHTWYIPPLFRWLKQAGKIEDHEMARTFNLGLGLVLIVGATEADSILNDLHVRGYAASVIGSVALREESPVEIRGTIQGNRMRAMVVGGGGREHALGWKLAHSPYVEKIYVVPGNGGTLHESKIENLNISATDTDKLIEFAQKNRVDLTVIGPETPLVSGMVDDFNKKGLRCFGPTKKGAQIEASKAFAKSFMQRHGIPTANYTLCTHVTEAADIIKNHALPMVIKADGLAGGKGVIIAHSHNEALQAAKDMLSGKSFGDAGRKILIEDFLEGEEVSFIVITDGDVILPLATSQDHKKRDYGEKGPNTGGMGAYSPAPIVTDSLHRRIIEEIIEPAVQGMKAEGMPFTGFLYAGLMITKNGDPKVLEFNCRLGDPESQPIMMRLKSDLFEVCNATIDHQLNAISLEWDCRPAVCVVLAARGYPIHYVTGDIITGIPHTDNQMTKIFHAGTLYKEGKFITNGGRVMGVTAMGDTFEQACQNAYELTHRIYWPTLFYRQDIGSRTFDCATQ